LKFARRDIDLVFELLVRTLIVGQQLLLELELLELLEAAAVAPTPAGPCAFACAVPNEKPAARIKTAKPVFFM